ncbi:MAG: FAD-dependent oxidoreductase [Deltaproteobacteria bacterium]|nr:FAD-dependent oxidoreductase [Deltaproteobacteria bacterium]
MTAKLETAMEQIEIATGVLVVGGGMTGVATALEVAQQGYPVTLIEAGDQVGPAAESRPRTGLPDVQRLNDMAARLAKTDSVEVLTAARLDAAAGVAGDFKVWLSTAEDVLERRVGAIVVAAEFDTTPLFDAYGLAPGESVIGQSEVERRLAEDPRAFADKTVAFVAGFAQNGNPLVMQRIFHSVKALQAGGAAGVYVYVGDLKVADDGLEREYRLGRDGGAIYFKLRQAPAIAVSEAGAVIGFHDPVVRQQIEVAADCLVVEEALGVGPECADLAAILRIDIGPQGFLQSDNIYRFPVATNREGIFVAGASREVRSLPWALADARNAALRVAEVLGDGTRLVPRDKAVVDIGKCTFCLTCYRCCPHGAIYWQAENKPVISPVACQGCGICASECPMDAIQIGGFSDEQIRSQIGAKLADVNGDPAIVAFCCQNSALVAGEMAAAFRMNLPAGLRTIQVPCAGKIDLQYILDAFVSGADGVLVMACHPGNCKSERGNTYAGWRVEDAQRLIAGAGLEPERLRFATLAANMGTDFQAIVIDMEQKIRDLGKSRLR